MARFKRRPLHVAVNLRLCGRAGASGAQTHGRIFAIEIHFLGRLFVVVDHGALMVDQPILSRALHRGLEQLVIA
jgi:hypothetical protein